MKKRGFTIITILLLIGVATAFLWFGYLYKDARNVSEEDAAFTVTAEGLTADYEAEQQKADTKYLNKTIAVSGVVTTVTDSVITLDGKVF